MKLNVGVHRKLGQPDFGSVGARCDIELELDGTLLFANPDVLQDKIRTAYSACERAVAHELSHLTHRSAPTGNNGQSQHPAPANGHQNPTHADSTRNGSPRPATSSQIRALHAIANRQGLHLTDLLKQRFHVYKAEKLSIVQVSDLIDELKGAESNLTNGSGH